MKRIALALALAAGLLAQTPIPMAFYGSLLTRFEAKFTSNGLTPANPSTSWPVSECPAPTVAWWGDDPTGALGKTTHAFTLTGSTESINTPFCPDGGWDDITSGCMTAQHFDGTNDWYKADDATLGQIGTSDLSYCVVFADHANNQSRSPVRAGNAGATEGWGLISNGWVNGNYTTYVHDGASFTYSYTAAAFTKELWNIACGGIDYDGNHTSWAISGAGVAGATPHATSILNSGALTIGACSSGAACAFHGTIAAVFIWPGTLFTVAESNLVMRYFQGILDSKGAAIAGSTTVGPVCATIDGQIECYGDDWQVLGSEMPPGSGSTGPSSGLYVAPSQTNSIVQSGDLETTWGCTGGAVAPSTTSPFRDGRLGDRLTDDNAGASEQCQSANINIASLNAGDPVRVTFWAHSDSAQKLNVMWCEDGGGAASCESVNVDITTTWTRYTVNGDVDDTANTVGFVTFCAGENSCAGNAPMGHADINMVSVWANNGAAGGQAYVPPFECPTTTAAVTCGSSILGYTITGRGIVNGAGAVVGSVILGMDFAPTQADNLALGWVYGMSKDATDYLMMYHGTNETMTLSDGTAHGASAAINTPGTFAVVRGKANYDADAYYIELNGSRTADATADVSPTGITTVRYGLRTASTTAETGGFWIRNSSVRK